MSNDTFYSGTITDIHSDGTYDIRLDNGRYIHNAPTEQITPNNTTGELDYSNTDDYSLGTITEINSDNTYDIHLDDGRYIRNVTAEDIIHDNNVENSTSSKCYDQSEKETYIWIGGKLRLYRDIVKEAHNLLQNIL